MKFLKSKKVWVAILTGATTTIAMLTDNPGLGDAVMYIGIALIAGIGLQDHGKEAAALKEGKGE